MRCKTRNQNQCYNARQTSTTQRAPHAYHGNPLADRDPENRKKSASFYYGVNYGKYMLRFLKN